MAIRFRCQACQKSLEVDDPEAGKAVLCFYCHSKITVPDRSDPSLGTPAESSPPPAGIPGPTKKPHLIGALGLIFSLCIPIILIVLFGWGLAQLAPYGETPEYKAMTRQQQEKFALEKAREIIKRPFIQRGWWSIVGFTILGFAFSLAGIITRRGTGYAVFGTIFSGISIIVLVMRFVQTLRHAA